LTIDACVEHVHFERGLMSLEDVGWRATQAAVSDLAAMGARPVAALSNLTLPSSAGEKELRALARGQAQAARSLHCPIVGGNLTRGAQLALVTAVVGTAAKALLRSGARPGHELWLVGDVGLAAAGLAWLRKRRKRPLDPHARRCIAAFRRPRALLSEGAKLIGRAHACCDVSDGLARDALHLAEASGVRIVIEERALGTLIAPALEALSLRMGTPALDFALHGGEDYALLATGPKAARPRFARRVGRVERGRGGVLEQNSGQKLPLAGGFDHFASR
jgi:thiamine-monophosphate kinase